MTGPRHQDLNGQRKKKTTMKMAEKLSQTQKDNQRVMPRRKQGKESSEEVGLCCPRPHRGRSPGRPRGLTSERSRMPEEAGKNLTHWARERKGEKVGGTQQTLSICSRAGGGDRKKVDYCLREFSCERREDTGEYLKGEIWCHTPHLPTIPQTRLLRADSTVSSRERETQTSAASEGRTTWDPQQR